MKRIGALVAIAALLLTACTSSSGDVGAGEGTQTAGFNPTGLPIVDEPLTLRFSGAKAPLAPEYGGMSLIQDMEAQTGITIKWENLPESAYLEQKNLLLASGELPDAFFKTAFTDAEIATYGANGTLVPLEDLIDEHAPNLQRVFERRPELRAAVTAPDGHIYTLPATEELGIASVPFFWSINKTWLDELGLDVPSTVEEYREALVAFKTQDPNGSGTSDEIPLSFMDGWWCADIGDLFAALTGMPDNTDHRIVRDGQVIFTAMQPEYRDAIAELHQWFADGLIDPEAFTQDDATYLAKGKTEVPILGSYVWWETEEVVGPDRADDYVLMAPLEGPAGRIVGRSNLGDYARNAFAITSANAHPEATMRWVDQLYDPVLGAQFAWGPIGEVFEQGSDGKLTYMDPPEGTTMGEFRQLVAPGGPTAILREDFETVVEADPRAMQRVEDLEQYYLPYIEEENYPPVFFTEAELQELSTIEADVKALVTQRRADWIVNGGVEDQWDAYVGQLEQMGARRMVEIYQAGLDRYNAEL